jgi:hypothetical protein
VALIVFYSVHRCKTEEQPQRFFCGEAGGVGILGAMVSPGHLFVNEHRIYGDTSRFQFNNVVAYLNENFLDDNLKTLGHFHGGGGLSAAIGGGGGRWHDSRCDS